MKHIDQQHPKQHFRIRHFKLRAILGLRIARRKHFSESNQSINDNGFKSKMEWGRMQTCAGPHTLMLRNNLTGSVSSPGTWVSGGRLISIISHLQCPELSR